MKINFTFNPKKVLINSIFPILCGVLLVAGIIYAATWTEPTATPPGLNVSAPVNVSTNAQTLDGSKKLNIGSANTGILTIDGALVADGVAGGTSFETHYKTILATVSGNVGIGTANPGQKLHIGAGQGKAQADDFCLNSDPNKCLSNISGGSKIVIIPGVYADDNKTVATCGPVRMGGQHADVTCRLYTSNGKPYIHLKIEGFAECAGMLYEYTVIGNRITVNVGGCGVGGATCELIGGGDEKVYTWPIPNYPAVWAPVYKFRVVDTSYGGVFCEQKISN